MSIEILLDIISDKELKDSSFANKILLRAIREGNGGAIKTFFEKISNLFVYDTFYRKDIIDYIVEDFDGLKPNSLIYFAGDSIAGNVSILYYLLLTNQTLDLLNLKTLYDTGIIQKIREKYAESLIPKDIQVSVNLERDIAYFRQVNFEEISDIIEFFLSNRLLKRDESSIVAIKAINKKLSSPSMKLRSQAFVNREPEDYSIAEYKKLINEYAQLISELAEEPKFQAFFEQNPFFLCHQVIKSLSKQPFGGEFFPDFVLELSDRSILIVEIEKPACKLYAKGGDPTHELGHAEQQVIDYLSWAKKNNSFLREHGIESLNPDKLTGLVVIGSNLPKLEQDKLAARNSNRQGAFIVKTFSDIVTENVTFLRHLSEIKNRNKIQK